MGHLAEHGHGGSQNNGGDGDMGFVRRILRAGSVRRSIQALAAAVLMGTGALVVAGPAAAATSTSTAVTSSGSPSAFNTPVTYTATVTPAPDGGTAAFFDGVNPIPSCGTQTVDTVAGTATCSTTPVGAGPHSITATYSGDTNFAGSGPSSSFTQTVSQGSTSVGAPNSSSP